jgi:Fe-S cluster assembly protein SufD
LAEVTAISLPQFKGRPGWEFTDLTGFSLEAFTPVAAGEGDAGAADRASTLLAAPEGAIALGQVDGRLLDEPEAVEDGPVILPLSTALERHPELVEPHLGRVVDMGSDAFTAANDADWTGGAFVYVPRGVRVEAPILLTAITDAAGTALHRRTLIVLDEDAEAEV